MWDTNQINSNGFVYCLQLKLIENKWLNCCTQCTHMPLTIFLDGECAGSNDLCFVRSLWRAINRAPVRTSEDETSRVEIKRRQFQSRGEGGGSLRSPECAREKFSADTRHVTTSKSHASMHIELTFIVFAGITILSTNRNDNVERYSTEANSLTLTNIRLQTNRVVTTEITVNYMNNNAIFCAKCRKP